MHIYIRIEIKINQITNIASWFKASLTVMSSRLQSKQQAKMVPVACQGTVGSVH